MSHLFTPYSLGPLALANRIVVAPSTGTSAHDGCASDWHPIHLGQLAISGAGLLIMPAATCAFEAALQWGLYAGKP